MRRSKIIGVVLMLTLVAAACGSGNDKEPAATGFRVDSHTYLLVRAALRAAARGLTRVG